MTPLPTMIRWVRRLLWLPPCLSPERQRALDLLAAIDAGGLPLNPAKVNDIARQLGLEVSARAPVAQTIDRIRACTAHWRDLP